MMARRRVTFKGGVPANQALIFASFAVKTKPAEDPSLSTVTPSSPMSIATSLASVAGSGVPPIPASWEGAALSPVSVVDSIPAGQPSQTEAPNSALDRDAQSRDGLYGPTFTTVEQKLYGHFFVAVNEASGV